MPDYAAEVNATPLDHELFMEFVNIAIQALSGKRRAIPPDAERCFEDATEPTLYLRDIPDNQMGMSIVAEAHSRFNKRRARYVSQSFIFRWFAIQRAYKSGRLAGFIQAGSKPGMSLFHSSIFEAAADAVIDADGDFGDDYYTRATALYEAEEGHGPVSDAVE